MTMRGPLNLPRSGRASTDLHPRHLPSPLTFAACRPMGAVLARELGRLLAGIGAQGDSIARRSGGLSSCEMLHNCNEHFEPDRRRLAFGLWRLVHGVNQCPTINVLAMLGSMEDIQTSAPFPVKTPGNLNGCSEA